VGTVVDDLNEKEDDDDEKNGDTMDEQPPLSSKEVNEEVERMTSLVLHMAWHHP
jgi:hypothetical protein